MTQSWFDSSLIFVLIKFGIEDIFDSLETMCFLALKQFKWFSTVFSHNFLIKGKFQILIVLLERSGPNVLDSNLFKKYFFDKTEGASLSHPITDFPSTLIVFK